MKYKEVYDQLVSKEKRKEEKYNIVDGWIMRPISILFTLPFLKTKISPTTITKISVFFATIGFGFFAFGQNLLLRTIGWAGLFLWAIFDGVDGNIARCTNQCSKLGDLWDTFGGYLAMVYIYFGAGIGAFYDNNAIDFFEPYWWIIIGGATAIFSILPRLVMHKKKSSEGNTESVKSISDKKNFGFINIIAMNIICPSGLMQFLLLIAYLTHILNIFILCYFVIVTGVMLISLYRLLKE